jgi:hypothetical protein
VHVCLLGGGDSQLYMCMCVCWGLTAATAWRPIDSRCVVGRRGYGGGQQILFVCWAVGCCLLADPFMLAADLCTCLYALCFCLWDVDVQTGSRR